MLSEFIVTLLYPSHTRWINCVNTQYFHLSWWQEGLGGPGRKRPHCYLSDSLAAAARSSFFDQNFPWERGNTAFQLVSLYAWHQQMLWASPSSSALSPGGERPLGWTRTDADTCDSRAGAPVSTLVTHPTPPRGRAGIWHVLVATQVTRSHSSLV